jgi:hypothetical protein
VPDRAVSHRHSNGRSWLRDLAWTRALHQLKNLPGTALSVRLARRLIRAWGDDATAVSPEFLVQCHKAARVATGTIVDFGAGVTTIVMTMACRGRPASVLTFEHDPERRRRVRVELAQSSRRGGDVRLVPLDRRDDVAWPAADLQLARRPIAFVACHAIGGLSDPREAWRRIVAPALPDNCPVYFDPPEPEKANGVTRTGH